MSDWFDELAEGMEPAERDRLRTVHDLLVEAGPPAELPPALASMPELEAARTIPFPRRRRRVAAVLVLAAALAAAVFGGGYLLGDRDTGSGTLEPVRAVTMKGTGAVASLRVNAPDEGGNWPVEFEVQGLPNSKGKYSYYEIFVLRRGKPGYPCAGFRVSGQTAEVSFSVPYEVKDTTRWVVTIVDRDHEWPGRVVMT
jgi:hypothetical protein